MDLPVVSALTHLAVFLLGVATWLPFTLWEGHHINEGATVTETEAEKKPRRRSFPRGKTIALFVIIVSLFVVGMGWQQNRFQAQQKDREADFRSKIRQTAECYQEWGKGVTKALDARASANAKQTEAERARDDAVDGVLLVALGAFKSSPPLTEEQRRAKFGRALNRFGEAKERLLAEDKKFAATKQANQYPTLDC